MGGTCKGCGVRLRSTSGARAAEKIAGDASVTIAEDARTRNWEARAACRWVIWGTGGRGWGYGWCTRGSVHFNGFACAAEPGAAALLQRLRRQRNAAAAARVTCDPSVLLDCVCQRRSFCCCFGGGGLHLYWFCCLRRPHTHGRNLQPSSQFHKPQPCPTTHHASACSSSAPFSSWLPQRCRFARAVAVG